MAEPSPERVARQWLASTVKIGVKMELTIADAPMTLPESARWEPRSRSVDITMGPESGTRQEDEIDFLTSALAYRAPGGHQRGYSEIDAPEGFVWYPGAIRNDLRKRLGITLPRGAKLLPGTTHPFTLWSDDPESLSDGDYLHLHTVLTLPPDPDEDMPARRRERQEDNSRLVRRLADKARMDVGKFYDWWLRMTPREFYRFMKIAGMETLFYYEPWDQWIEIAESYLI